MPRNRPAITSAFRDDISGAWPFRIRLDVRITPPKSRPTHLHLLSTGPIRLQRDTAFRGVNVLTWKVDFHVSSFAFAASRAAAQPRLLA